MLASLSFAGFEQPVQTHGRIMKYLKLRKMTSVKRRSRVVVLCTLSHLGTHSSEIRGVSCLIGETELN